ncbi:MFS transporter [Acinetobacter larvae]|uniref:MFS transporter n=1 Tax=Acinetobacter larvae TaxID=1789224 RepID=A0A1B2M4B7_9GAMM|nr:MFS transporter [Acinetobacter larvae]AOA59893.1 MFS transporter [Acinetobacter larvae]
MNHSQTGSSRRQLLIFIGILLIATNLRAPFTGLPPLLPLIQTDFALSTVATGALTTLPLLAFALLSPVSALFARKFGLEKALFIAVLTIAIGILLRSVGHVWSLFLGTWVLGMGIAAGNVLLPSVVKRDFPNKVAALTGAYALTMGIAAALGSATAIPLAQHFGWQWALLALLLLPISTLLVWSTQLKSAQAIDSHNTQMSTQNSIWRSALAWQVTLFLGLNSTIYYVIVGWLPSILADAGLSATEAGSLHGIMQLATALPGLIIAPILHRLHDQRIPAVTVAACSAIALLGLWLAPQFALLWSIFFGIGTGAGIILGLAFIGLRTHNAQQAAALSGMSQCIGYLLAAVGPMLFGALHDVFAGWHVVLILCTLLAVLIGIIGLWVGRNRQMTD